MAETEWEKTEVESTLFVRNRAFQAELVTYDAETVSYDDLERYYDYNPNISPTNQPKTEWEEVNNVDTNWEEQV